MVCHDVIWYAIVWGYMVQYKNMIWYKVYSGVNTISCHIIKTQKKTIQYIMQYDIICRTYNITNSKIRQYDII